MKRPALLILAALTLAAATMIRAQDDKDDSPSFTVKCVLSGVETERIQHETSEIKEGVATDIAIQHSFKQENGSTIRVTGFRNVVPSPAIMANNVEPDADNEFITMGAQLTCRIRRAPDGKLLLDVTLTRTVSKQYDFEKGILDFDTRQLRSVQPVSTGQAITLSWPSDEKEETTRQVTITILNTK